MAPADLRGQAEMRDLGEDRHQDLMTQAPVAAANYRSCRDKLSMTVVRWHEVTGLDIEMRIAPRLSTFDVFPGLHNAFRLRCRNR